MYTRTVNGYISLNNLWNLKGNLGVFQVCNLLSYGIRILVVVKSCQIVSGFSWEVFQFPPVVIELTDFQVVRSLLLFRVQRSYIIKITCRILIFSDLYISSFYTGHRCFFFYHLTLSECLLSL